MRTTGSSGQIFRIFHIENANKGEEQAQRGGEKQGLVAQPVDDQPEQGRSGDGGEGRNQVVQPRSSPDALFAPRGDDKRIGIDVDAGPKASAEEEEDP